MELFYDKYLQAAGSTPSRMPPSINDYTAQRTLPHCLLLRLKKKTQNSSISSEIFLSPFRSPKTCAASQIFRFGIQFICFQAKGNSGEGGLLTFQKDSQIGGPVFVGTPRFFLMSCLLPKRYIVYTVTIDISHCHPQNYKSYLMDSFTYSIIPHPWCITLDSFPDLSKKIRVQDPLLPKLGFLIFRTPGTVGIYQHLVWGLPKKPWKKHWEIIALFYLGAFY